MQLLLRGCLLSVIVGCGCVAALTSEGARVSVYQAPLTAVAAKREMPAGCRQILTKPPVSMTELEMQGQDDPYRGQRNEVGSAGGNALLVLAEETRSRRDFNCPSSSRITDCPGTSGAWYRVVFEGYECTPEALQTLAPPPKEK